MKALPFILLALVLTACGGGGGGSSTAVATASGGGAAPAPTPAPLVTNTAVITVDAGPGGLGAGPNGTLQDNVPFVTITVCSPGSSANCQVIDHVELDTGSVGLRILAPVLDPTLLAALPRESDPQGNPVGECFGFVDSYMFGSVRQADVSVGGEKVAGLPLQIVADSGQFNTPPAKCSSGAGTNLNTVNAAGANGILGLGVTPTDCGSLCTMSGGFSAAIYYDCPASGCGTIIGRTSSTSAPFQQLPNFAAALGSDNNGVIVSLPAAPVTGEASLTGTLFFGIGTRSNNGLGAASILFTTTSTSNMGPGFITAIFNSSTLNESYIDSGTSLYLFDDASIANCTGTNAGYYCPSSPLSLTATLNGLAGSSAVADFTVANADSLLMTQSAVLPGLAGNPKNFPGGLGNLSNSFAFGLPFFYGRNIYVGIEGTSAGSAAGPFFAF